METNYLQSAIRQFKYYKSLGDKTFTCLTDEQMLWRHNDESNSVAIIIKHLSGNMLSRFTEFLQTDGEKPWRNRDAEFDEHRVGRDKLISIWENGWQVLFNTLNDLTEIDLDRTVYIRTEPHTVLEAINRQLAHYPYHVGQIVFIGKMLAAHWQSLSIPRGNSDSFNKQMFNR